MEKHGIIGGVFVVAVLIMAVEGYNMQELCNRNEISSEGDFFIFGSSYADWGNWDNYLNGKLYHLDGNGVIQPPTTWYSMDEYSVNRVNGNGRWSDGKNWVDFVANYYNMDKHASSNIGSFPPGNGYAVNFAIGGATHNGNVYNRLYSPGDFASIDDVEGNYGYTFQVNDFLGKLRNSQLRQVGPNDVFIYDFVGGTDMPYLYNCANQSLCADNFVTSHLNNLKMLYDAGMRNLLFMHIDALFHLVPSNIKFDTANSVESGSALDQLCTTIFNPSNFYLNLTAFRTQHMPLLNLQRISYQDVLGFVIFNFNQFGIRNPLNDDADPRFAAFPDFVNPNIPFPTQWDYFQQTGVVLKNVFFADDNQLSEFSSRIMAKAVIKYLEGMVKNCDG